MIEYEKIPLFCGMSKQEIIRILNKCSEGTRDYPKNCYVLKEGEKTDKFGILLEGKLEIINEDYYGNNNYIKEITEGFTFAESFAFCKNTALTVSVVSKTNAKVLWLNGKNAVMSNNILAQNIISELSKNVLIINTKMLHMSQRTTKQKLLSYLFSFSKACGKDEFEIPLKRGQLADYLGVERSAMCAQLSKLRKEGIITYKGSRFKIEKNDLD